MSEIRIKRGASLGLTLTVFNPDGSTADLTTVTLSGQIRTSSDELVASLTWNKTVILNVATATFPDTSEWPTGTLRADTKLVQAGLTDISETVPIFVDRAVSQ